jgi:hypothetical protein
MAPAQSQNQAEVLNDELEQMRQQRRDDEVTLRQLLSGITEIRIQQENQGKLLEELKETVIGNGQPGLKLLVDRHERLCRLVVQAWWIAITPILGCVAIAAVIALARAVREWSGSVMR